jgi:hypothetical protein
MHCYKSEVRTPSYCYRSCSYLIRMTCNKGISCNSALIHTHSLGGKIVKIKAGQGDDAIVIQMHLDVLSRNSEFFKRIVKPEWAELREDPDTIDMGPMHSAEEVRCYAHWLYSRTIPTRDFDNDNGTKSDPIWIDLVSNANKCRSYESITDLVPRPCRLMHMCLVRK